jgi:cytochrome P450
LSRYGDVRAALLDHDTYCSSQGFTLEDIGDFALPMMIMMDPPDHTRLRATVNRALTPRRMNELEQSVRSLARDLIVDFAARGGGDVIGEYAALLPMALISRMLRVPTDDQERLRLLADAMVHREDGVVAVPDAAKRAAAEIYEYFDRLVDERARETSEDLLSLLLAAGRDGDISRLEILGFCYLLIVAGNETTTKLIGNATLQLARHADQRESIAMDPSRVSQAIEEVLRFDPTTHMMARTLVRDVEIHGCTMRAGAKVALILASANRDERFWNEADVFDSGRTNAKEHLAFGFGVHHCVGAALARIEARVAIEELLLRMPGYRIDESGLVRMHSGNVRGYARMPVM